MHSPRAFTLIELLIVVAVVAILAAIAVPNFLEAQIRAKISRGKSDIRNIATGLESYYVDWNAHPFPADHEGVPAVPPFHEPHLFDGLLPPTLTTPTAYLSSLPDDPFAAGDEHLRVFHYGSRVYDIAHHGDPHSWDAFMAALSGRPFIMYMVLSHGPDRDQDITGDPAIYDPSNGTVSTGDLIYFGPSVGFNPQ